MTVTTSLPIPSLFSLVGDDKLLVGSQSKEPEHSCTTTMRKKGLAAITAATVATVTVALCNSHCAHAFYPHTFHNNVRRPLHLDPLDPGTDNEFRLTSTSLIMAVTDPETLLAERVTAKKKKKIDRNCLHSASVRTPGSRRSGKDSRIISSQDLAMLESSFGLDSSTIQRQIQKADNRMSNVQKKKHTRRKILKNSTRIKVQKDISAPRKRKSPVKKRVAKKKPTFSVAASRAANATTKQKNTTMIKVQKDMSPKKRKSPAKKRVAKKKPSLSVTASRVANAPTKQSRKRAASKTNIDGKKKKKTKRKVPQRRTTLVVAAAQGSNSKSVGTAYQHVPSVDATKPKSKENISGKASATQNVATGPTRGNKGKSSTMPGFMDRKNSKRHKSFRDGLKIAQNSNIHRNRAGAAVEIGKFLNSAEETKKRTKANSEAMYYSSSTVPDSLIAFANEFHQESRITPKEETELGTKTQEAIHLQRIHDELKEKLGRDPSDNEWCAAAGKINIEALELAIEEGMHAKDRLVTSNLRMVQGVVNLYIRNGLGSQYNAGDLMQDGTIALIRAAEKFEPKRGFRFSTYAMYWIRAAVKRSQILQSRIINVPQRHHETHKKILKVEMELRKELGRQPSKEELANSVGITEAQLERCTTAIAQQCFSLDSELENTLNPNKADTNKDTMYNILSAQYDNAEYSQQQSEFMKEDLVSTLQRYLTPHEVNLLLLRYGLMDERTLPYGFSGPLTIAEVSRLVDLKPDKVRRMINKSLRQLRHLIAHEWEDFEDHLQKDLRNQI